MSCSGLWFTVPLPCKKPEAWGEFVHLAHLGSSHSTSVSLSFPVCKPRANATILSVRGCPTQNLMRGGPSAGLTLPITSPAADKNPPLLELQPSGCLPLLKLRTQGTL